MPSNMQQQNSIWGCTVGILPEGGPLVLNVPLDLTATTGGNGKGTVDVLLEIESNKIDFVQSAFIDNSQGAVALILTVSATQHRVVCPPQAQGVFALIMPPGGSRIDVTGDTKQFLIQLFNMPMAPSVWKVT